MGRAPLGDQVIGVEDEVFLVEAHRERILSWREALDRWHPQIDHESTTGPQVVRCVSETLDLLGLRPEIGDAVPDQEDEGKVPSPRNDRRRHVAHNDEQLLVVDLASELGHHRIGQFDARHRDPPRSQRDANTAGPDGELQRRSSLGQALEVVDRRLQHRGCELGCSISVVLGGGLFVPHFTARHGTQHSIARERVASGFRRLLPPRQLPSVPAS